MLWAGGEPIIGGVLKAVGEERVGGDSGAARRQNGRQVMAGSPAASALALQRLAGNAATAALLQARQPQVQRACGPACGCAGCGGEKDTDGSDKPIQRDAAAATAGAFQDVISEVDNPQKIGGTNAADYNNNVTTRLGGDGGSVAVSGGSISTSLDDGGKVNGAIVPWTITKTYPVLDESQFSDDGEKAAARALTAQLVKHEGTHRSVEVQGRTGFAKSLRGLNDSDVDGATAALECRVGTKQRALDNTEGMTTINADNSISTSPKDHPEYVSSCPSP